MQLHVYGMHHSEVLRDLTLAESVPSTHLMRQGGDGPPYRLCIEVGVNGQPRPVREKGKAVPPLPDICEIQNAWRLDRDYRPWQMCSHLKVFARWETINPYFLVFDLAVSRKESDGKEVPFRTRSILEVLCMNNREQGAYLRLPKGVDHDMCEALVVQAYEPVYHQGRVFVGSGAPELQQLAPDVASEWLQHAMHRVTILLGHIRRTTESCCYFDSPDDLDKVLLELLKSTSLGRLLTSLGVS